MRLLSTLLIGLLLLLMIIQVTAQDDPPAPQFLYRHENRIVLVDGYTGETTELPFEVADQDRFEWSPDGRFLLAHIQEDATHTFCLNLYDVDEQEWEYDEPISCAVEDVLFATDGTQIAYSSSDEVNATVWLYSIADQTNQVLYRTTEGTSNYSIEISNLQWSPTEKYLTFVSYFWILGGTLNMFVVMNTENQSLITLSAPDPYYASYTPIWSEDDNWFLITLLEEYVTSGTIPHSNHLGDVYLVNSETGEEHRLTYTPAAREVDVQWTDDGKIAFTMVTEQKLTFTLEEAMNVEVVPPDAIITPEPVDVGAIHHSPGNLMISPDPDLSAWVSSAQAHEGNYTYALNFGKSPRKMPSTADFSVPITDTYQSGNILIGWRPSDYSYPQG
jgi:Tol biopolymer transport system component